LGYYANRRRVFQDTGAGVNWMFIPF